MWPIFFQKIKWNCLIAGITSYSHEMFLGEMPRNTHIGIISALFRYIFLPSVALSMLQLEKDPDKEYQIHRHDVGSSSAETRHSGSNQHSIVWYWTTERTVVQLIWGYYVLLWNGIVEFSVLKELMASILLVNVGSANQKFFFVFVWFSEVQRIKLLTPWIWTRSHKDSKQPCQSFNPR